MVVVQVVAMHAVTHVVQVVVRSVTARHVRHVHLALIVRRARVQMIVRSGVNRLRAAKPFASYLRLVVVARAGALPNVSLALQSSPIARLPGETISSSFLAAGLLNWEIDLWGRIRRQTEAANAQLLASEEGRRAVILSLVGSVSGAYINLRDLDRQAGPCPSLLAQLASQLQSRRLLGRGRLRRGRSGHALVRITLAGEPQWQSDAQLSLAGAIIALQAVVAMAQGERRRGCPQGPGGEALGVGATQLPLGFPGHDGALPGSIQCDTQRHALGGEGRLGGGGRQGAVVRCRARLGPARPTDHAAGDDAGR